MTPEQLLLMQDLTDEQFEKRIKRLRESRRLRREHTLFMVEMAIKKQAILLEIQQQPSRLRRGNDES